MKKLYYDTAMAGSNNCLAPLVELADKSHIVYGSDWPWYPEVSGLKTNSELAETTFLTDAEREAIYRNNALKFLPRIK